MKKIKIFLPVIVFAISICSCKKDNKESYGSPVINYVITSNWSDTITSGSFEDWITLLGDNFVNVKSLYINDLSVNLPEAYITPKEITFQIPDSIPNVINDLIKVETDEGVAQISFKVNVPPPVIIPERTASWLFDDPSDLLKAETGSSLVSGWRENVSPRVTHIPSPNAMTGFTSIDGPETPSGNKALRIGKWYFLVADLGINPNGGGKRINDYTIMIDFRVSSLGKWYTFMQSDLTNNSDGEIFINTSGAIGNATTGYSSSGVTAGKWQRLVISVKLGEGGWLKYYLDGENILDDEDMSKFPIDAARFSLDSKVVLFGDNDGDDGDMDVAEVAAWDVALDEKQVSKLCL
ncbi:MAG: hypothetical protein LKI53_02270 [Bacteroidales bacterium]|jgi:hypothetical protein|nr:hypothetical protein [Bacteroidales bacterium]